MNEKKKRIGVAILLSADELRRLDSLCGPRAPLKRQDWIAQAIREKLEREKTEGMV